MVVAIAIHRLVTWIHAPLLVMFLPYAVHAGMFLSSNQDLVVMVVVMVVMVVVIFVQQGHLSNFYFLFSLVSENKNLYVCIYIISLFIYSWIK
jgi:hypothetical protein